MERRGHDHELEHSISFRLDRQVIGDTRWRRVGVLSCASFNRCEAKGDDGNEGLRRSWRERKRVKQHR